MVRCKANNRLGDDIAEGEVKLGDLSQPFMVTGYEEGQKIAEGDFVKLECGAIIYNYTNSIVWTKDGDVIEDSVMENNTKFSWRKTLTLRAIAKEDSGVYKCEVKPKDDLLDKEVKEFALTVSDTELPVIITNFNQSAITRSVGDSFSLECLVSGLPVPSLKWYKDDLHFTIDENNSERIEFQNGNSTIYFKVLIADDAGDYKCVAWSRVGEDVKSVQLEIPSKSLDSSIDDFSY
jgi:hypothetical protein